MAAISRIRHVTYTTLNGSNITVSQQLSWLGSTELFMVYFDLLRTRSTLLCFYFREAIAYCHAEYEWAVSTPGVGERAPATGEDNP